MLYWVIEARDRAVGICTLSSLDAENRRAELSLGFGEPGDSVLAMRAHLLALQVALGPLGLHKVYAHVYQDRTNTSALLQRMGWRFEGELQDHYWIDGTPVTVVSYACTRAVLEHSSTLQRYLKRFAT